MDAFTLAIVEGALATASEEIFVSLQRTSQSTIIYEVLDYATGILDARGDLVTQGNGVTGFLGSLSGAVRVLLASGMAIRPGDIFITNDPYDAGGTHLCDVTLIAPYTCGGEILGFGAAKAHWTEVGGMAPGSWTTDAPDIYAEGLQIPLMRLMEEGRVREDLVALIIQNVRTPRATHGDLRAQMASLLVGERRIRAVAERFGAAAVREAMADIVERGRQTAMAALRRMPCGTYSAEDFMDDDGAGGGPVPIRVSVTISEEEFLCDFSGSAPAVPGTINGTFPSLESSVRTAFRALLPLDQPTSDGMFAPVRIVCPPGTVFTAQRPTPVSTYWESSDHATDLVLRALASALGQLPAGHSLSVCATILAFAGSEPRILIEPQGGGWGASAGQDGESALVPIGDGDTCATPAEILERTYPLLVEEMALNTESGGNGTFRGGYGLCRTFRLREQASLTTTFGRSVFRPWGLAGGEAGTNNRVIVEQGDGLVEGGKFTRLALRPGDRVRLISGRGGGYGPPEGRAPADVERDIQDGLAPLGGPRQVHHLGTEEDAHRANRN